MITGKNLEGSGSGLIEVLLQHLPGGTEKNAKNIIRDSTCVGVEFEQDTSSIKSTALPPHQSILSVTYQPLNL
jgi:hypothetical protein